ncbi:MAG: sigma-54-dependent Fis family transcriptional regulator [Desulfobacteraceae bacterium]|nr:sigma-54-dependent Fis family transcriptional regulator [Desulfobacteraceae bacterium]
MEPFLNSEWPVLLVDDEKTALDSMEIVLLANGISQVLRCRDSRDVLKMLRTNPVNVVLLDFIMPYFSGEEILEQITGEFPHIQVIIVTGMDSVETAVKCMKKGAFEYLVKPVDEYNLITTVKHALEVHELKMGLLSLQSRFFSKKEFTDPSIFSSIITKDPVMFRVFDYIEAIAGSRQPVTITGESGTGKELVARALHQAGSRDKPFCSVNIAGLDDAMFSDTLFGHVKGAFTGAQKNRAGFVEKAGQGVLFLDEIGDLNPGSQVKLLRMLQEREYYPLGSDSVRPLEARIIAATNYDLKERMEAGQFRKDLYYRLFTHSVKLPPLRERKQDIPHLLAHFIKKAANDMQMDIPILDQEIIPVLQTYDFPGNIRELQAMVFDAMTTHDDKKQTLPLMSFESRMDKTLMQDESSLNPSCNKIIFPDILPDLQTMTMVLVQEAMDRTDNNQTLASRMLGISQPALSKRLKKLKYNQTNNI